jgi:hypothetical protein
MCFEEIVKQLNSSVNLTNFVNFLENLAKFLMSQN